MIVRAHHAALAAVEGVVNGHYLAWRRREHTPLEPTLDAMYARWLGVHDSDMLTLEWPVRPLPRTIERRGSHAARQHGRGRTHVRSAVE